jgi:hypothetical protein
LGNRNEKLTPIYENYHKIVCTYLCQITKTTASFIQTISDLQMEIIDSWRNAIDSAFVLLENFENSPRTKDNFPDMDLKMIIDVLSYNINITKENQNKMLLASIDVISQNSKSFYDNLNEFDEFRSKIIEHFISQRMLTKVDPETIKKAISDFKKTESIGTKGIRKS